MPLRPVDPGKNGSSGCRCTVSGYAVRASSSIIYLYGRFRHLQAPRRLPVTADQETFTGNSQRKVFRLRHENVSDVVVHLDDDLQPDTAYTEAYSGPRKTISAHGVSQ